MKTKYLLLLSTFFTVSFIIAQEKLKVTYSSQMKMEISDLGEESDSKKIQIKKALQDAFNEVVYYELITSSTESSYKKIEKINNDLPVDGNFKISFSAGGSLFYKNIEKQESLSQVNSFNQKNVIKDSLKQFDWKITREKKKILGYDVRKATYSDSTQNIVVWYAPKVAMKTGPEKFWGLPGLILEVNVKKLDDSKSEYYYKTNNIEVIDDNTVIEKPNEGKIISQEEFDEKNKKQMERFKEMYSDGVDTSD